MPGASRCLVTGREQSWSARTPSLDRQDAAKACAQIINAILTELSSTEPQEVTKEEIERRMDELAREYGANTAEPTDTLGRQLGELGTPNYH